jgi:hypothetical protein
MKKKMIILLFLVLLSLPDSILGQRKLHIGLISGLKYERHTYEDEGGDLIQSRFPRLKLGALATYQFTDRFAFEFGVNSDNTGSDIRFYRYTSPQDQGVTMLQFPFRLRTKVVSVKNNRFQAHILSGFSYLFNWQEGEYLGGEGSVSSYTFSYSDYALKRHILLLDYGFQLNWQGKRLNFFINQYWQNAFTPIAEKVGTYSMNGQDYDFKITAKGRASVLMIGLQYQFRLRDKDFVSYVPRRERVSPVPDSARTWGQFFGRNRFALVLGSPLFLPRNQAASGEGAFKYLPAPGFMVGMDYDWHFNEKMSLRAGVRAGFQHYVYSYSIKGENIGREQNFTGSSSAENAWVSFPVQLQIRKILNRTQYLSAGMGISANFFIRDTIAYIQPKEAEFPNLTNTTHYFHAPNPSFSPTLSVGYGKMLRNGNVVEIGLRLQQGISKIMDGKYQFIHQTSGNVVGEGRFMSRDSYAGIELSYHFNALRRQMRKNLLTAR